MNLQPLQNNDLEITAKKSLKLWETPSLQLISKDSIQKLPNSYEDSMMYFKLS